MQGMPPPSAACNDVADWLNTDFIGSFVNDGDPGLWTPRPGGGHYRGFFSIALIALSYCEAMSGILAGVAHGGQGRATRFLEDRVAPHARHAVVEARYRARSALLFSLYRNGIAHQREPGRLDVDANRVIWGASRGHALDCHLRLVRLSVGPPAVYRLTVDVDLLYAHVLSAFREVAAEARQNPALAQTLYDGLVLVDTPRSSWRPWRGPRRWSVSRPRKESLTRDCAWRRLVVPGVGPVASTERHASERRSSRRRARPSGRSRAPSRSPDRPSDGPCPKKVRVSGAAISRGIGQPSRGPARSLLPGHGARPSSPSVEPPAPRTRAFPGRRTMRA